MFMIQKPEDDNKLMLRRWFVEAWSKGVALAQTHLWCFWGGVVAVVLVVALGIFAWSTSRTVASVEQDVSEILASIQGPELQKRTTAEGYAALISRIEKVEGDLRTLRQRAGVLQGFQWVPGTGSRIQEARLVLELGERFARGTRLTLQGYSPVVFALDAGATRIDIEAVRQNLESAAPLLNEAQRELDTVREIRARLGDPSTLGGTVQSSLERLEQCIPLIELAVVVARDTPQLVGEVLDLRNTVAALRNTVSEPSAFLERPQELEAVFKEVRERALEVQGGVLEVKNILEGEDPLVTEALDTALQMSVLLANLGDGLSRFAAVADGIFTLGPLTPEAAALLGEELPEIREVIQAAQQELGQLNELLASEETKEGGSSLMALLASALGSPALRLQREESLLAVGIKVVDFLTFFLGYDGPKTYLLIGQNDDEIRATGGFIGVVVEIAVEQGELVGLGYLDSTSVDAPPYDTNPLPPEPVYRYLWMGRLLFRDGNWNPHFPAAAAQLGDLYQRGQGVQVDGVIAATEEVVLDLVDAFGGVRVPQVPGLLDRNLAERYVEGDLPYVCLPTHVSDKPKRCFDEDLFQVVIDQLLGPMPPEARGGVVQVLLGRLQSKDVLVHVFDPQAAELLWERGWNGALKQVDHDYLMIVDNSLPGHARSVVERRVEYQVRLAVGQPLETELLVEYRHTGQEPDPDCRQAVPRRFGCYWNYLRILIPVVAQEIQVPPIPLHEGSEWLIWGYEPVDSLSVISSRGGQAGLTEIGGYVVVEPQTSVTLPLRYSLPGDRLRDIGGGVFQYRLLVQKQPGTPVEPVTLLVQLQAGAELVRASPAPTAQAGGWLRMDVDLAGDVTLAVDFRIR